MTTRLFIPDGGFPPLYECTTDIIEETINVDGKEKKKREIFGAPSISVSDILRDRRDVAPFLSLRRSKPQKKISKKKNKKSKKSISY
jgi:hypothetical protein